jgi:hypothetical protein
MRFLVAGLLAASLGLAGCATTGDTYDWGEYDELLYRSYKDVSRVEPMRHRLAAHIDALERTGGRVPPGLYAELGTLYLQAGDSDRAIDLYDRERAAWPESKGLMDALIANLERRKSAAPEPLQ